jgi:hypothetical protein
MKIVLRIEGLAVMGTVLFFCITKTVFFTFEKNIKTI